MCTHFYADASHVYFLFAFALFSLIYILVIICNQGLLTVALMVSGHLLGKGKIGGETSLSPLNRQN